MPAAVAPAMGSPAACTAPDLSAGHGDGGVNANGGHGVNDRGVGVLLFAVGMTLVMCSVD